MVQNRALAYQWVVSGEGWMMESMSWDQAAEAAPWVGFGRRRLEDVIREHRGELPPCGKGRSETSRSRMAPPAEP